VTICLFEDPESRFDRGIGNSAEQMGMVKWQKWSQLGKPVMIVVDTTRMSNGVHSI
jgi:hypothetical protein